VKEAEACTPFPAVYIIVTNFDNLGWKCPSIVDVLSTLVKIPEVHMIATTDNINCCIGKKELAEKNCSTLWLTFFKLVLINCTI